MNRAQNTSLRPEAATILDSLNEILRDLGDLPTAPSRPAPVIPLRPPVAKAISAPVVPAETPVAPAEPAAVAERASAAAPAAKASPRRSLVTGLVAFAALAAVGVGLFALHDAFVAPHVAVAAPSPNLPPSSTGVPDTRRGPDASTSPAHAVAPPSAAASAAATAVPTKPIASAPKHPTKISAVIVAATLPTVPTAASAAPAATVVAREAVSTANTDSSANSDAPFVAPAARTAPGAVVSATVPDDATAEPATTSVAAADPTALKLWRDQGDAQMNKGDVSTARLFYRLAAEKGDAEEALSLGNTYNPAFLAQLGVLGMRGDAAEAASWYRRARALGAPEADRALTTLPR